jgi:hypothetical protein
MADWCEYRNEHLCFIKGRNLLKTSVQMSFVSGPDMRRCHSFLIIRVHEVKVIIIIIIIININNNNKNNMKKLLTT